MMIRDELVAREAEEVKRLQELKASPPTWLSRYSTQFNAHGRAVAAFMGVLSGALLAGTYNIMLI